MSGADWCWHTHRNAEIISMLLADVLHQVQGTCKAALNSLKAVLSLGRVATQRQHVLNTQILDLMRRLQRRSGQSATELVLLCASGHALTLRRINTDQADSSSGRIDTDASAMQATLLRASSSCSFGMFVHVRCIIVSTQICNHGMLALRSNSSSRGHNPADAQLHVKARNSAAYWRGNPS